MENLTLYNKFKTVPEEAQKKITGGRLSGFTDINPMWRIKMLTEQYGPCGIGWYTDVDSRDLREGSNGEIAVFVCLNLYVKISDTEWSKPIYGEGGSMFVSKEKAGLYTSDECFKMAYTDALSVACKALGMGADIYFEKDRTKYDKKPEPTPPPINPEPFDTEKYEAEISEITNKEDMKVYWDAHKELKSNPEFSALITKYGKSLK